MATSLCIWSSSCIGWPVHHKSNRSLEADPLPRRSTEFSDAALPKITSQPMADVPLPTDASCKETRRPIIVDIILLAFCFCLGMGAVFASISVVSLVVAERVNPALSLVPSGLQKVVSTLVAFPGARYRTKKGFAVVALVSCVGYAMSAAAVALIEDKLFSFGVICLSYCVSGMSDPFVQFLRFSAADIAPAPFKPKAIAYVVAGGSLAALAGPELANLLVDAVPGHRFAGSYLGIAMLLLLQACIVVSVDFSPAASSRPAVNFTDDETQKTAATAAASPAAAAAAVGAAAAAPAKTDSLASIVCLPQFILVASTAAIVQMTMVSPMQICPLAMEHAGFQLWHSVRVIQAHILGMYIPSFFTGHLISMFGKYPMMLSGVLVNLIAASCLLLDVSSFWGYFCCLTMIGVGWNWGYVSASSLLTEATEAYTDAGKAKAKGFNDFCVHLLSAVGTVGTGVAVARVGWAAFIAMNVALLAVQLLIVFILPLCEKRLQQARNLPA